MAKKPRLIKKFNKKGAASKFVRNKRKKGLKGYRVRKLPKKKGQHVKYGVFHK